MRVKLKAEASTIPGTYELTAIPKGAEVPMTFVRLRLEYLKKLIPMIKSRIKSQQLLSSVEGVKAAQKNLEETEGKVERLELIHGANDTKKYDEYIKYCAQFN